MFISMLSIRRFALRKVLALCWKRQGISCAIPVLCHSPDSASLQSLSIFVFALSQSSGVLSWPSLMGVRDWRLEASVFAMKSSSCVTPNHRAFFCRVRWPFPIHVLIIYNGVHTGGSDEPSACNGLQ